MTDADPDFLAFLQQEETRALDSTLLDEVETAIKSYNGEEYGDEEDGRSRVVARDVAETTDYMLTSVLDAFVSSGRVVEFEPSSEDDEDTADDATEAMHYLYRRKSGYRLIHDWAKAGLLEKIGVVKSCVERKRKRVEGLYHPALMPDHAIEAEETDQLHPEDGSQLIKAVTLEEMAAEFRDYFVPLEEFRVAPDARDLDSAVYLCHLTEKSISDLVEMGFDPEVLDGVQGDSSPSSLANARDDGRAAFGTDRQGALRKVWLREEYVLFDLNGDGLAERLCVHRVGNTILAVEECDYQPFEYWCPYPMQGRLIGQSLADKTVDIQRVNTALERNGLDSLYMSVAPGTLIHESSIGDNTIEDLLTIRPRRIVRWKGSAPPIPEQVQDISQIAFSAIEFKTRQRESRTGITRLNKGVDEDTLNDTAKGQAQLMSRGQQMERYIIRNFAEGVARLFMKKVGLDAQIRRAVPDPRRRGISPGRSVAMARGHGGQRQGRPWFGVEGRANHVSQHDRSVAHTADAGSGADLHLGECLQQPRGRSEGRRPTAKRYLHPPGGRAATAAAARPGADEVTGRAPDQAATASTGPAGGSGETGSDGPAARFRKSDRSGPSRDGSATGTSSAECAGMARRTPNGARCPQTAS
jgi:hypothetical protein